MYKVFIFIVIFLFILFFGLRLVKSQTSETGGNLVCSAKGTYVKHLAACFSRPKTRNAKRKASNDRCGNVPVNAVNEQQT